MNHFLITVYIKPHVYDGPELSSSVALRKHYQCYVLALCNRPKNLCRREMFTFTRCMSLKVHAYAEFELPWAQKDKKADMPFQSPLFTFFSLDTSCYGSYQWIGGLQHLFTIKHSHLFSFGSKVHAYANLLSLLDLITNLNEHILLWVLSVKGHFHRFV
jgi:hypothetical protein